MCPIPKRLIQITRRNLLGLASRDLFLHHYMFNLLCLKVNLLVHRKALSLLIGLGMLLSYSSCTSSNPDHQKKALTTLGRHLFFEKKLSINHSKSCASCHDPSLAFTDGYRRSVSTLGENLPHNSPSLLNTQSYRLYDWANPTASDYIGQMQRPLYSHTPTELGLDLHWSETKHFLDKDSLYKSLFKHAFGKGKAEATQANIHEAIAAYLGTLHSSQSPYHRYIKGDKQALTSSALNGLALFKSEKLKCAKCHLPPTFTLNDTSYPKAELFVNIGLYNLQQTLSYPEGDRGLYGFTRQTSDEGKFKIPSLLNVAITAPYMHDGSVQSLDEILDIYARGGRLIKEGPSKGDGALHKNKHPFITGFTITPQEKSDLIAFLHALTDTSYLQQEQFLNPFRIRE
jgi:cytochrome c peroxidase